MSYRTFKALIMGLSLSLGAIGASPIATQAETLRFASAGDAATLDPHSNIVLATQQMLRQIYEPLFNRDKDLKIIPGLAVSWEQADNNLWRVKLRPNVLFHDGSPLVPDDVVFSLGRAAARGSQYQQFVDTVASSRAVDDQTVEIRTTEPDPILIDKLSNVAIMSKSWSEKNNAALPQDLAAHQEAFTARRANGTGPYLLKERSPGSRTVLVRNDRYWGEIPGNVTEYVSLPIASPATRVAALLSGQVDFVLDPPFQDLPRLKATQGVKLSAGTELRTMFLTMNLEKDQLPGSTLIGKNPFRDRRVRQALYQAIDIEAIVTKIMNGYAVPTGLLVPPGVRGFAEDLNQRLSYDVDGARKLLTAAGYPNGFDFTYDCSNDRYVNDEALCLAIATMWSKIGVKAAPNAMPMNQLIPKMQRRESAMFQQGSSPPTLDAFYSLQAWVLSPTGRPGDGLWNVGGYKNEALDKVILSIRDETDLIRRDALIHKALEMWKEDIVQIPLYNPMNVWAMRDNVDATYRPDNQLEVKWVTVKK